MAILLIFIPPAVEPAHAPVNIKNRSIAFEKAGQVSKFALEKPVVDEIVAT